MLEWLYALFATAAVPLLTTEVPFHSGLVTVKTEVQDLQGLEFLCVLHSAPSMLVLTAADDDCISHGVFRETIATSGWNRLKVRFNDNPLSCFAAGLVEGTLMGNVIEKHVNKVRETYAYGNLTALYEYYQRVDGDLMQSLSVPGDEYKATLQCLRSQLEGIRVGAGLVAANPPSLWDLYLLNTDGDIDNLFAAIEEKGGRSNSGKLKHPRCSALLKLVGSELYLGHTTMEDYREMNRVLKSYASPSFSLLMSSYPGVVSSTDDFIMTSANLAIVETSLPVRESILREVRWAVPAFMRVQSAARLSRVPSDFERLVKRNDTFTYCSQWMVVDFGRAEQRPLRKAFYVMETAPNYTRFEDLSQVLESTGFWGSYNWPYFPSTLVALGWSVRSYTNDVRGELFEILHRNIHSLEDMQTVMQFNNWSATYCNPSSLLSPCSPEDAISPRSDLLVAENWYGGTDSKVTSRRLMETLSLVATSGPTHQTQTPFQFPEWYDRDYLPRKWEFQWILESAMEE